MEQLQEVFGPLVDARLQEMTQPTVKREAETGTAPAHRSGSRQGSPRFSWPLDPDNAGRKVEARDRERPPPPRTICSSPRTAPPPILGSAEVEAGARGGHRPLITANNAPGMPPSNATDLGSLVVDETRPPLPHGKLMEVIQHALPLTMKPFMIHRFHATRPLASNMTGVTTFQLDVSNRTSGHEQVWECLETMTGLSALQIIGMQLRRDQSPAAERVQKALAEIY